MTTSKSIDFQGFVALFSWQARCPLIPLGAHQGLTVCKYPAKPTGSFMPLGTLFQFCGSYPDIVCHIGIDLGGVRSSPEADSEEPCVMVKSRKKCSRTVERILVWFICGWPLEFLHYSVPCGSEQDERRGGVARSRWYDRDTNGVSQTYKVNESGERTIRTPYPGNAIGESRMKNVWRCLAAAVCFAVPLLAQEREENYVPEKDPLVQAKLAQWQDYKLGLLLTWGTYSQWGIVESWSLCGEDEGWCQRRGPYADNYDKYKKAYENLKTTFNPVSFDPDRWANTASEAGMRYVVFTTKHHDGFCMFNTKTTDYKITSQECAFHSNPRSNVAMEIFDAFRKKGLAAGVYYSKPDWHSPDYWGLIFPPPTVTSTTTRQNTRIDGINSRTSRTLKSRS